MARGVGLELVTPELFGLATEGHRGTEDDLGSTGGQGRHDALEVAVVTDGDADVSHRGGEHREERALPPGPLVFHAAIAGFIVEGLEECACLVGATGDVGLAVTAKHAPVLLDDHRGVKNWTAVESITNMVKHNDEVTVGSLKTGRRFVHIQDIIQGIILAIGINGFNIINLSGDKIITLNEIIKTSEQLYNKSIIINEKNPSIISLRNPSNEKAKKILNWKPEISLKNGLKTIDPFI